ncbi:MAG: sulfur carrier protein ThiS [Bacillota bacterium]|nr:sulfur carrier protein ThiS [Bacillota bacterium]MDP4158817.1 sulfur carrier protein ThiS [Bacillota bacterium]
MIKLNNRDYECQDGITVEELMKLNNFTYARIIVYLNGEVVLPENYASTTIHHGDDVKAIHLMAGG